MKRKANTINTPNKHVFASDAYYLKKLCSYIDGGKKIYLSLETRVFKFRETLIKISQQKGLEQTWEFLKTPLNKALNQRFGFQSLDHTLFQGICGYNRHWLSYADKLLFLRELAPFVDVNYAAPGTEFPVFLAFKYITRSYYEEGLENFHNELISFGFDFSQKSTENVNLLTKAVALHRNGLVEKFIDHGADINIKNHDGDNAIRIACQNDNPIALKILIEKKAIINPIDLAFSECSCLRCVPKECYRVLIDACVYVEDIHYFANLDTPSKKQNKIVFDDIKRERNWLLLKPMFLGAGDKNSILSILPAELFRQIAKYVAY